MKKIRKPESGKKNITPAVVGILILIIFIFLLIFNLVNRYIKSAIGSKIRSSQPESGTLMENLPQGNALNIILLGFAGGNHEGSFLTDTIVLASIFPKQERIDIISIPRDLWVFLPLTKDKETYQKINAAYAYGSDNHRYLERADRFKGEKGGGNLAKYAVNMITGLPIDYYVSVDFSGFVKIINILGGLDVDVPASFTDKYFPVPGKEKDTCGKSEEEVKQTIATLSGQFIDQEFSCRFEEISFLKGVMHMDGETVLKFVRSRHSETAGGDFGRNARQQAVLEAARKKIISGWTVTKFPSLIKETGMFIKTDMDIPDVLGKHFRDLKALGRYKINTIILSEDNVLMHSLSPDNQYILIPKTGEGNWNAIHNYLKMEFEKNLSP